MAADSFFRSTMLGLAGNRSVQAWFKRHGLALGVSRFVAGETLGQAVEQVKRMNEEGLLVTLDHLGESVRETQAAEAAADTMIQTLQAIAESNLRANVSVKLSQLGICMDYSFCLSLMRRICSEAAAHGNFVRIDMEDSGITQITMDMYRELLEAYGPSTVGLVIQSYLYRSLTDVNELGKLGANLRIVKGAYREPPELAFPQKRDVDLNFLSLVKLHLANGCYTAVATHDERIIEQIKSYAETEGIARERIEFQMLYGIAGSLQKQLAREGYRVRVYTPFGEQWYPYFTRRIAERPANLLFVLKGMLRK